MALVGQAVPEERKSAAPYSRYRSPERSCDLPNQSRMKSTTSSTARACEWSESKAA